MVFCIFSYRNQSKLSSVGQLVSSESEKREHFIQAISNLKILLSQFLDSVAESFYMPYSSIPELKQKVVTKADSRREAHHLRTVDCIGLLQISN